MLAARASSQVGAAGEGQLAPLPQASGLLFAGFLLLLVIEYLGVAGLVPILKVTRFPTLLAWSLMIVAVLRLGPKVVTEHRQLRLLWYLVLFTGASVIWAVVRAYAPQNFRYMLDYFGLALITVFVMDRSSRLTQLSVVFSGIILVLVVRNADKLTSSERAGSMLAGYFLGDGNDLAWGLVTMLVFPLYLLLGKHGAVLRGLGLLASVAALGGIIGTQSRGATLALGAAVLTYWLLVSTRKLLSVVILGLMMCVVLALAPPAYFDRLRTLESVEEDSSAQGRLRAWRAAVSMAVTRPLGVGAGSFNSAYGRYYMPADPQGWGTARWISAHSMYFKVLGEYGFLGLFLLFGVIFTNVLEQLRMRRLIRANPDRYEIPELWPGLLAVGMAGYSVSAAFLGGVAYPHLFVLTGLTVACRRDLSAAQAVAVDDTASARTLELVPAVPAGVGADRRAVAAYIAQFHARHSRETGRTR